MTIDEILEYKPLVLKKMVVNKINVELADGSLVLYPSELALNRYIWEIFNKTYKIPIMKRHSITSYFSNNMFNGSTVNKTLSAILKDMIKYMEVYHELSQDNISLIHKSMMEIVNDIYSEFGYAIAESVINIDINDLLEIQLDKELMADMDNVKKELSVDSIDKAYNTLDRIIRTKKNYKNNPLARAYVSGMVNSRQVKQMLGPRGFVTEIDSSIFKYPIPSSFTLGLNDLYSMSTESRSAAKALVQSNIAIRDSEYFARELQLTTMLIEKLEYVDCGNTDYIEWTIRPEERTDEAVTYKGDLPNLVGKRYKLSDTDDWRILNGDETELIGQKILLRSVFGCKLKRKHNVCLHCFGELGHSVPGHANLGHVSTITLSGKLSQSILSTKHLTASATSGDVALDDITAKIFKVKGNGYVFNTDIAKNKDKVLFIVSQEECPGLKDVISLDKVRTIDPERISKIELATVEVWKDDKVERYPVTLKSGNRKAVLESKFLEHVVKNGISIDENGNYVIDITKWKLQSTMMWLPEVEFSYFTLMSEVKLLITKRDVMKGGVSKDSPESLITKLFSLVNSKLSVNIAPLEVIIYAFMVKDLENDNYDLARGVKDPQLANMRSCVDFRSMGAAYGFQALVSKVFRPRTFFEENKTIHPMDVLFKPQEVMEHDLQNELYDIELYGDMDFNEEDFSTIITSM